MKRGGLGLVAPVVGVLLDDSVEAELKLPPGYRPVNAPGVLLDDSVEAELKRPDVNSRQPVDRGVLLDDSVEAELKPGRRGRHDRQGQEFSSTTASRPN